MSLAERKLPQYCRYRCRGESFKPNQGIFVDNKTHFVCFDCLNRNRRYQAIQNTAKVSDAEVELLEALHITGRKYKQHFKIDRYEFDFAFPDERILLELDGVAHTYRYRQIKDKQKEACARQKGWKVARVRYGPGLIKRVSDALAAVVRA